MVLREIFDALRRRKSLEKPHRDMLGMLEDARWMFARTESALKGALHDKEREEFFQRDIRINRAERSIRKDLVQHLAVSSQTSASAGECLVLMSVIKDAERLGDYCKNIVDLVDQVLLSTTRHLWTDGVAPRLQEAFRIIAEMFDHTHEAFDRSDEKTARKVLLEYDRVKEICDGVVQDLIQNKVSGIDVSLAVPQALLARFLRRLASHLENVNSSVLVPVHRLDFDPRVKPESR